MQSNAQLQEAPLTQRDVSSTARLFNFNRPVYMSDSVWKDCVELVDANGRIKDELSVLQRLRHVLFMASSALHGDRKSTRLNSSHSELSRMPSSA